MLICEYSGGGFGSKGAGAVSMAIPALLSKKANAPVMMRISREEESYIGRARTNMTGRAKVGFAKDGRITALDLFIVQDTGAYGPMGDFRSAANAASLIYQPVAMRVAGRERADQHAAAHAAASPGPMQANGIMEPVLTKAAKQLGLDQVAIRRINSPEGKALYGAPLPNGQRRHITSAFVKEALDRGGSSSTGTSARRRAASARGRRCAASASTVGPHGAGSSASTGHDDPAGRKLYVQSGVGNLGTHSVIDLARVAADILAMPWEKVEVIWGNTGKDLPWTLPVGRQPDDACDDARQPAGAMDAKRKLQEIAAKDLGGSARRLRARRRARVPAGQSRARAELRAGRAARDRARRQVRRPRSCPTTFTR